MSEQLTTQKWNNFNQIIDSLEQNYETNKLEIYSNKLQKFFSNDITCDGFNYYFKFN